MTRDLCFVFVLLALTSTVSASAGRNVLNLTSESTRNEKGNLKKKITFVKTYTTH
jgi:hypothetical protein